MADNVICLWRVAELKIKFTNMKPNIELAEKLLKTKYSLTEDGLEFKLQYPILVRDLAFIMQKYTDQQCDIQRVSQQRELLIEAFYLINIHDGDKEKITKLVDLTLKTINGG